MDSQSAVDLGRQAIVETMIVGAPVLLAGLAIGLVIGLLQALTQIQEQTVSTIPKIVGMILVLGWSLPWLVARLVQYSQDLLAGIPGTLH